MEEEYLKRWRLILGGNEADGTGITLTPEEQRIDQSLEAVYDSAHAVNIPSPNPIIKNDLSILFIVFSFNIYKTKSFQYPGF